MNADRTPSDAELLRRWEERIVTAGDPLGALAEVLSGRREHRAELFQQAGRTLLGCQLGAILGAGGVGVTYLAKAADDSKRAVKLVSGVSAGEHSRFEQECRLLRSLEHPAIVRYHDHTVLPDGTGVLVMDYVDGIDLDCVLRDAPTAGSDEPPWSELLREIGANGAERLQSPRYRRRMLRLLATVAEGLHAAHEQGIVHRDVKPANILVGNDLTPMLIDFGLARDQHVKASFTASGAAMGTLAYMAPEQLLHDPGAVDARADTYALGLVLYRALTGEDLRQRVATVIHDAHRPFVLSRRASHAIPTDVQAILYRCLEHRPAHRYATAHDLAADLRAAATGGTVVARRPSCLTRALRNRRLVAATAAGLALLVAIGLVVFWPRGREVVFAANVHPTAARVELADGRRILLGTAVWMPCGTHIVRLTPTGTSQGLRPIEQRIKVDAEAGRQRIAFITIDDRRLDPPLRTSQGVPVMFTTGHSQTAIAPGLPFDERFVNGQFVQDWVPFFARGVLPSGTHELRARDGRGRAETQLIRIDQSPVDVQLLAAWMSRFDGCYRRTWSTVLSPRPDDLEYTGNVETWLGMPSQSPIGGSGILQSPCAFVPAASGQSTIVTVRCRLPAPMRSAVVRLRATAESGSHLMVEAGFADAPLRPWPLSRDGLTLEPLQQFQSEHGCLDLVIRANMRSDHEATPYLAGVRFLEGMLFGGHWRDEPPCLAIVADTGHAARLPEEVTVGPHDGARWAVESLKLPGVDGRVVAMQMVSSPSQRWLWCCVSDPATQHGALHRFTWPALEKVDTILPGHVHPRLLPRDGETFGSQLFRVADLDGDSCDELAVCDPSSARLGRLNGGTIALLRSSDNAVVWTWPRETTANQYGDGEAFGGMPVGDWDGNGEQDMVVSSPNADDQSGALKGGRVEVVAASSGKSLWTLAGRQPDQRREVWDCWSSGIASPATLLLRERRHGSALEGTSDRSWRGHFPGLERHDVDGLAAPRLSDAALVGPADGAEPCQMVVARFGPWQDEFVGLERYAPEEGRWKLEAKSAWRADYIDRAPRVVRVGDLDKDDYDDIVVVLPAPANGEPLATIVSGRSLGILGSVPLDGHLVGLMPVLRLPDSADGPLLAFSGGADATILLVRPR